MEQQQVIEQGSRWIGAYNPNGKVVAASGQEFVDTEARILYRNISMPAGTDWLVVHDNTVLKIVASGGVSSVAWADLTGLPSSNPALVSYVSTQISNATTAITAAYTTAINAAIAGLATVYEPIITAGTTAQYWRGDKTWQTLNTAAIAGFTLAVNTLISTALGSGTEDTIAKWGPGGTTLVASANHLINATTGALFKAFNAANVAVKYQSVNSHSTMEFGKEGAATVPYNIALRVYSDGANTAYGMKVVTSLSGTSIGGEHLGFYSEIGDSSVNGLYSWAAAFRNSSGHNRNNVFRAYATNNFGDETTIFEVGHGSVASPSPVVRILGNGEAYFNGNVMCVDGTGISDTSIGSPPLYVKTTSTSWSTRIAAFEGGYGGTGGIGARPVLQMTGEHVTYFSSDVIQEGVYRAHISGIASGVDDAYYIWRFGSGPATSTTNIVGLVGDTGVFTMKGLRVCSAILANALNGSTGHTFTEIFKVLWNAASTRSDWDIYDDTRLTVGSTTGLRIGTATTQKLGFFNVAPVTQPAALTAADINAPNSGDATTDTLIANMRTRINELETKLQSLGLIA